MSRHATPQAAIGIGSLFILIVTIFISALGLIGYLVYIILHWIVLLLFALPKAALVLGPLFIIIEISALGLIGYLVYIVLYLTVLWLF